jgi:hypothetical protein
MRMRPDLIERHPALTVFLACFIAAITVLVLKNLWVFDAPIVEDGDFAANSIIIEDARHFDLLVGNYSRQHFSHPGPAVFYVQAAGEAVSTDLLGVTPAPYNGQALAVLALNSALVGLTVMTLWRHLRSAWVVGGAMITLLAFASAHDGSLASTWMPYIYIAPFLLLCVAGASVATGETASLWCLALAAGLLVHGHVEFAFFVPIVVVPVVVSLLVIGRPVLPMVRATARHWWTAAGVLALFLLPIALNLALNYPGEIDDYLEYARSDAAGGHSFTEATNFVLDFWSTDPAGGQLFAGVLVVAAVAVVIVHPRAPVRRFGAAALAVVGLATVSFIYYAMYGIDVLSENYVGFFFWGAPITVALILLGALVEQVRPTTVQRALLLAFGAAVLLVSLRGPGLTNGYKGAPDLPADARLLDRARTTADQPIVLDIAPETWPDAVGVLVESHRRGVEACLADESWEFMVTKRFVCDTSQRRTGLRVRLRHLAPPGSPPSGGAIASGEVVWRTPLSEAIIESNKTALVPG